MVYHPDPPSQPPALIEALAVWGWAVQHGGIPLAYAAAILAEHACYTDPAHTGVEDATTAERRAWAAEDLTDWEDIVVRMDWPGDDAVDAERWDQPDDWWIRQYLLERLGLPDSCEPTDRLLLRHCAEQIAACERQAAEDDRTADEGK